ncbi:MAG: sensor histidine kinase, partial [Acidimicrobiales bacterium]
MSLRSRLLLVVLGLVAVGLAATDFVTFRALRSFLVDRVDQQLVAARDPVVAAFTGTRRGQPESADALIPSGSYAAIVDVNGTIVEARRDLSVSVLPNLKNSNLARNASFTVDGTRQSWKYRVLITPLTTNGDHLLIAIPLREVTQTLHRLLFIEALASGLIVMLVGGAALVLVRAGLRPLEDIGDVAGAIAEGDLSQRVPRAEGRTEVGRLGLSLNAMLGQIQAAFEARQASEARLRRFVADASHELRTPLTSIRGYAELFRRGAAERPADLEKAMRRIEEESARMGLLVDDLLLLARLDQGRPLERSPVDLVRVAADAVDDARAAAPERAISLDAPAGVVIEGDELRLRQVAANLVANACQHTPVEAPVVVRVARGAGGAVLEVVDGGPGLDAEAAQKVFERFYRADPSRARAGGGSGLGLSIVAAIAEAHGGRATVEAAPGAGACFRVTLPAAAPVPSTEGAARAQVPAQGAARAQVPAQGAARAQVPAQGAARAQVPA